MINNKKVSNSNLYKLLFIRKFEETLLNLFQLGEINGTTHTCIGQEEIPVSIMPLLIKDDFIFSNHRGHGHYLARFNDAEGLLSEIMGREGGVCNGIGGSQHIKKDNYFSTGIQGESVPVAAGVALKIKEYHTNPIAVVFIGDGTWGQGSIYETLNIASLWKLPLVIVCENNGISQSTPTHLNLAGSIKERALAFDVDYYFCDDNLDVESIKSLAMPAIEKVRVTKKPAVIEIKTRRLSSHSKGDDTRSNAEINNMLVKDWKTIAEQKNAEELIFLENKINLEIDDLVSKTRSKSLVKNLDSNTIVDKDFSNLSLIDNEINESVLQNLNNALHFFMGNNKDLYFIGEDILDPYGGAFKVSKGLSTKYPKRVLSTPISELAIAGIGNGLALSGQKVIVEFMFADFVFLAFDQIINFAAKTVSMYGTNIKHKILFRCPVGGNRGYGATHSQSVQKHFIGIPNLDLYELSPLHDCHNLLNFIFETGNPSMLFENKVIYAKDRIQNGFFLDFFNHIKINPLNSLVFIEKRIDVLLISGGGLVYDCINVAKKLFLEHEISVHIINPLKIYPFDISSFENLILEAKFVVTVEESTEGGIWGSEISNEVSKNLPNNDIKFLCLSSKNSVIPSSRHLESEILINSDYIFENILKAYKTWKK